MSAKRILSAVCLVSGLMLAMHAGTRMAGEVRDYRIADRYYDSLAEVIRSEEETVDFRRLYEINPDVMAWLRLPETELDYPIVQGKDNDWYLEHLFTGEAIHSAALFADYRNQPGLQDRNTIIYGHNMKDGTMFSVLENYRDAEFFRSHNELSLILPNDRYILRPFAVVLSTGTADDLSFVFADGQSFMAYLQDKQERSLVKTNVIFDENAHAVTLSTCRYDAEDGRLLLFCIAEEVK